MSHLKGLLPLMARYQQSVTRLAAMHLRTKAWAPDIVKIIFEELYELELFYDGPHLKSLLIQRIRSACNLVNRLSTSSPYSLAKLAYPGQTNFQ